MRPDFILKNVMVYQTFRQCFEKRDVAVAGEKFYCVSPAISYPGVQRMPKNGRRSGKETIRPRRMRSAIMHPVTACGRSTGNYHQREGSLS